MLILVTGGSASGKSEYAESQAVELAGSAGGKLFYLATMMPFDEESRRRIERHRAMRKEKRFETGERYTDLGGLVLPKNSVVLLECMSNLTANEMYGQGGAGQSTVEAVLAGLKGLRRQCSHVVVVTNEIFSDGISYDPKTCQYQQYLGEINCRMAEEADEVVEVVYGIPVFQKQAKEKRKRGAGSHEETVEQL